VAHDQNDSAQARPLEAGDAQLRSLISLFNWLVGEVVTARVMVLRLAADLVRMGVLPVEEINGMPLTQEIIDSVMSNFPQDPVWQALGQRLRSSLDALRHLDLYGEEDEDEDEDELRAEEMEGALDEDDDEDELHAEAAEVQVIYRNPDHELTPDAVLAPRVSRTPGRKHN
jgi:hypothetical protein